MDGDGVARFLYLGLIGAALAGWFLVEFRGRMGFALRAAAAWGLIFLGGLGLYGLWNDIRPQFNAMQVSGDELAVTRARDGHFYLTLHIGGTPVEFMVDTGASMVVLSDDDARRIGIDTAALTYLGQAQTANGTVRTARLRMSDVRLGPWQDASLPAYVSQGDMGTSLLGMDYLRLYRMEIDGDRMVLRRR